MRTHFWKASWLAPVALALAVLGIRAADDERFNDNTFVNKARSAGLAEVKAGEIAAQRAQDNKVKAFAQRMIDDHNKANREMEELAKRKGWTLATTIDDSCQKEIDKLSSATAQEFDRSYMEAQLKAHEEAVKLFQRESESGQDLDLKAWAGKTLPTLQEHLQMAKEASAKKDR
jgi:putative membrane protein